MAEASFDPTRLPRGIAERDLNSDTAFLGTEVSSPPSQNRNLVLPPGIHLHWQMPRELTRGQRDPSGIRKQGIHPRLPNRWLITRSIAEKRKRWIVESDYLHPIGSAIPPAATAYPMAGPGRMNHELIFRYLGRTLPLEIWEVQEAEENKGEYLDGLTVMGYGNPAFAAFAPNCPGLFTFHDPGGGDVNFSDYSVVGFYSNPAEAPSLPAVAALLRPEQSRPRILCIGKTTYSRLRSHEKGTPPAFLDARSARTRRLARRRGTEIPHERVRIAIGNSATEALSAFLGDFLGAGESEKAVIEDHLEAILMTADLEHRLHD